MLRNYGAFRGRCHTLAAFWTDDRPGMSGWWFGWSRSLYWRIALSFALFTAMMLVGQNLLFSYLRERPNPSFLSPNAVAMVVAADMQDAIAASPPADLDAYLRRKYADTPQRIYVALRDGHIGGNTAAPMPEDIRRATVATLAGADVREATSRIETRGPVVTAPIQVGSELRGIVVLPPPPPETAARVVARLLSVPGTLILITTAFLVSAVVFSPARRRLHALETAAERLGAGDLSVRAPEAGADEIARVARAFNVMAAELAARDEALRTSDRLRRQMVADVSHELKTPLTSMRGYVETLRLPDIALSPAQRTEYLDIIEHETKRLERIVQDLLDIARLENGVVTFERRYFATEQLFAHVVQRHRATAAARTIELIAAVDASADQLFGDPYRLEQVVENLVANAIRHAPDGGRIDLRAECAEDAALITVTDNGPGVAPEHIAHIFDRFYKVDAARAAGTSGSGLGLSIARAIVAWHGGTVLVQSRPGRTTFSVRLPQPTATEPRRDQAMSANL
jgi:two-component system OmpR family sensor kinase